jgi:hypothetical protein
LLKGNMCLNCSSLKLVCLSEFIGIKLDLTFTPCVAFAKQMRDISDSEANRCECSARPSCAHAARNKRCFVWPHLNLTTPWIQIIHMYWRRETECDAAKIRTRYAPKSGALSLHHCSWSPKIPCRPLIIWIWKFPIFAFYSDITLKILPLAYIFQTHLVKTTHWKSLNQRWYHLIVVNVAVYREQPFGKERSVHMILAIVKNAWPPFSCVKLLITRLLFKYGDIISPYSISQYIMKT